MNKRFAVTVKGNKHAWSFPFEADEKYLEDWRSDGLDVVEIVGEVSWDRSPGFKVEPRSDDEHLVYAVRLGEGARQVTKSICATAELAFAHSAEIPGSWVEEMRIKRPEEVSL